ncbi:hypothetical protein N798_00955 [Knoellia flava TL1]|uniref:Uncharacterized protein n=1 Tax=Knoellia flava TL1 TaxID=1385518 RepID=A0ABR4XIK7_9MICO|nr:hypothetical protein N798_00955 [Knoellia flava TL1]
MNGMRWSFVGWLLVIGFGLAWCLTIGAMAR